MVRRRPLAEAAGGSAAKAGAEQLSRRDALDKEPFILSGYRGEEYRAFGPAAASAFELHNETWNIWTHLLAAFYFLAVVALWPPVSGATPLVRACTAVHAGLYWISATAHTFGVVSERVSLMLFRADKAAIAIMFLASGACAAVLEFGTAQPAACALVVAVMAICCAVTIRAICGRVSSSKLVNGTALGLQMLLAASPVARLVLRAPGSPLARTVMRYAAGALIPSLIGGTAYVLRVPERFMPGAFDLGPSSHTLMHVGTAIGSWHTCHGLAIWSSTLAVPHGL